MRPRSRNTNIDWLTFSIYLALVGIGWAMIYAVGYGKEAYTGGFFAFLNTPVGKQSVWVLISLGVFFVTFAIDSKFWRTFSNVIYAASLFLLIAVLIFGKTIKGATSWFDFGAGITIQPSEFAKFGTCLGLASYLASYARNLRTFQSKLYAMSFFVAPMLLILMQPDAGSALVFLSFFVVLYREGFPGSIFVLGFSTATIFVLGLVNPTSHVILTLAALGLLVMAWIQPRRRYWLLGLLTLAVLAVFVSRNGYFTYVVVASALALFLLHGWNVFKKRASLSNFVIAAFVTGSLLAYSASFTFHNFLRNHQQERILVWLKPSEADPQGAAYNLNHSKMAISSGGILGKGYLEGNFTQGNFVPEQITDFIFSAVGEEQGFIGVVIIIGLYLLLLGRIIFIAERQRSDFNRLYAYGVAGIIFIHFFINVAMTMGLMPIIGIPLPFLSKGGSSLLGFSLMISVLLKLDVSKER